MRVPKVNQTLPLILHPDKRLTTPAIPVVEFNDELLVFIRSLQETMLNEKGLGLAANQVGSPYSVFVMHDSETKIRYFVNPSIMSYDSTPYVLTEGCLSIPGTYRRISRPQAIQLAFQDLHGKSCIEWFHTSDLSIDAVIVQHELDHLMGRTMYDHPDLPPIAIERL